MLRPRHAFEGPDPDRSVKEETMHIVAALLALIALIIFVADYMRGRTYLSLGLAFLTAAWMVQVIVVTGSKVLVD